jgi:hypothetical protein
VNTGSEETAPEIAGFTDHGWNRMQEYSLGPEDLNEAISDLQQRISQEDGSTVYVGKTATVVLNDNNWVVTVWRTGTVR